MLDSRLYNPTNITHLKCEHDDILTSLLSSGRRLLFSSSSFWTSGDGLGAGGWLGSEGSDPGLPIQLMAFPVHTHITTSSPLSRCGKRKPPAFGAWQLSGNKDHGSQIFRFRVGMKSEQTSWLNVSSDGQRREYWMCVCVCVCSLFQPVMQHLSGCEPTYLSGRFIVGAIVSLINQFYGMCPDALIRALVFGQTAQRVSINPPDSRCDWLTAGGLHVPAPLSEPTGSSWRWEPFRC